jgi:uncharacterized protein YbdZ (MbtH family)
MSMNPFDNENGTFYALMNEEGQYSLWPTCTDVPAVWTVAHGEETRKSCLDYVEEHWNDMRPRGLIEQMERTGKPRTDTRIE